METWFYITIAAAFLQNLRSLLQKRLTGALSVNGAAYIRFVYAVPFALLYVGWLWAGEYDRLVHGLNQTFFLYAVCGGLAQIVGTASLLAAFTTDNFAVGTAYSKTEAAQAAMVGLLILGDGVDAWVISGIGVSLMGVLMLSGISFSRGGLSQMLRPNRAMWLGLLTGAGFGVAAVCFRGASLAVETGSVVQTAGLTVFVAVTFQTLIMGAYLLAAEPGQLRRVFANWQPAIWVGLMGMIASAGWFTAMTMKSAGVVRAVGQIELLFTIITSVWFFKERLQLKKLVGILLVVVGIWLLI